MRTDNTKRYEKGTRKWWRSFGIVHSPKGKTFISDGIVVVKPEYRQILDCKYIWIERVTTSGLSARKRYWLPEILSSEWIIAIIGKPRWKFGWKIIRPKTYKGQHRIPPELGEDVYELFQCLKYPESRYYKRHYEALKLKSIEGFAKTG